MSNLVALRQFAAKGWQLQVIGEAENLRAVERSRAVPALHIECVFSVVGQRFAECVAAPVVEPALLPRQHQL